MLLEIFVGKFLSYTVFLSEMKRAGFCSTVTAVDFTHVIAYRLARAGS